MQVNQEDSGPKLSSLVVLGVITAVTAFMVIGFALGWFAATSPTVNRPEGGAHCAIDGPSHGSANPHISRANL